MGIRSKLLDFKSRLQDRKMYSVVLLIIATVAIWGFYQYKKTMDLRQELDNQYNRAFFEMTGYVENVETLLAKSMITSTTQRTATTMQEAWRQANMAETNLGQLPITPYTLSNTSKFLTQVGDYAYSMNKRNMDGKALTEKDYKTIERLHGYSVTLGDSLERLKAELTNGRLHWGELADKGTPLFSKTSTNLAMSNFENVDKNFQEYPTLIYDGPFSDGLSAVTQKAVTGKNITQKEAEGIVRNFIGKRKIQSIESLDSKDVKNIEVYSFKANLKTRNRENKNDVALVDITKKGGHVIWMLADRAVSKTKLNVTQAKKVAKEYLNAKGFKGMKDTYYIKNDGTAVINYAYDQEGTTAYPDLIKVKVALDDGEITGFDAKSYLASHIVRKLPKAVITKAKARAMVNKRAKVLSVGTAVIPTDFGTELFCYEIKGKMNKQDFLVYINAVTGKEENVLMIMDTPNGILTI